MIINLTFYSLIISIQIYVILTVVIKILLKYKGYYVTIINLDFGDFKNLKHLANKNHKYRLIYFAYMFSAFIPLVLMGLLIFLIQGR
jgi:hypothetical protein